MISRYFLGFNCNTNDDDKRVRLFCVHCGYNKEASAQIDKHTVIKKPPMQITKLKKLTKTLKTVTATKRRWQSVMRRSTRHKQKEN